MATTRPDSVDKPVAEGKPAQAKPPPARRAVRPRPGMTKFSGASRSREARRLAAVILEVLAGERTPTEAAEAVGVSVPRYYALEGQALEGLLKACEPRPRGPRRSPEREIVQLQAEIERLEREGARSVALLRATRRTVGLPPAERAPQKKPACGGKGEKKRRKRRPTARALRAAKLLRNREEPAVKTVETTTQGGDNGTRSET